LQDYYEMATSYQYQPPQAGSYEELERKYWKQLTFGNPIYGADVAASITDPEVQECNIAKLDSILKYLQEDAGQVFHVSRVKLIRKAR
jgi:jumonji domain-containing protein 2